jgi:exostosin family protein
MIQVPQEFRPHQLKNYPQDNENPFEEWFGQNYDPSRNKSDREYLPVYWTSYYCNKKHGRDLKALQRLQEFLDTIDRSKKYFTIVQYDDGILNNVSHLDLKVFGMGCKGDVQLPLVCQPHKYEFKENGRPIFASFIGSITHPIREQMVKELQGKEGYFISAEPTSLHTYCYIMSQSKYVICCRGYGLTSFRIAEALQYGAIPIYHSNEFLFDEGCIRGDSPNLKILFDLWNPLSPAACKKTYEQYYTYESVANQIYDNL